VPGIVEYIHPLHNLAMVSYDPKLIGDTPVQAAVFSEKDLIVGEKTWVTGLKGDHQLIYQETTVASIDPLNLPLSRTMRFRDSNIESISLVNAPVNIDGVLVDKDGKIAAKWVSFAYESGGELGQINGGISAPIIKEFITLVISEEPVFSLEAELGYMPLFAARKLGLSDKWLNKIENHNSHRRRLLVIRRIVAGSSASEYLKNGDIILTIDDEIVSSFRGLERKIRNPKVSIKIWRDLKTHVFEIEPAVLLGTGINHVVSWAGTLLQNPHRSMAAQRAIEPNGIYVAFFNYGSPASRYGLWAGRSIVGIDEDLTPDLETFIDIIKQKKDNSSLRIRTITWNGATEVVTIKPDNHYWPAYEIRRNNKDWSRFPIIH